MGHFHVLISWDVIMGVSPDGTEYHYFLPKQCAREAQWTPHPTFPLILNTCVSAFLDPFWILVLYSHTDL